MTMNPQIFDCTGLLPTAQQVLCRWVKHPDPNPDGTPNFAVDKATVAQIVAQAAGRILIADQEELHFGSDGGDGFKWNGSVEDRAVLDCLHNVAIAVKNQNTHQRFGFYGAGLPCTAHIVNSSPAQQAEIENQISLFQSRNEDFKTICGYWSPNQNWGDYANDRVQNLGVANVYGKPVLVFLCPYYVDDSNPVVTYLPDSLWAALIRFWKRLGANPCVWADPATIKPGSWQQVALNAMAGV